jgi:hypothetical protein
VASIVIGSSAVLICSLLAAQDGHQADLTSGIFIRPRQARANHPCWLVLAPSR